MDNNPNKVIYTTTYRLSTLERRAPQTTTDSDPQVTRLSDVLLPTHVGIPVTTTTQTLYTLPSSASMLPSNEVMTRNRLIDPLTMQAASPYVPSIQLIQRWGKAPPVDPFTAENNLMTGFPL